MPSRRLFWYLVGPYVLILLGAFMTLTSYTRHEVRSFYIDGVSKTIAGTARLVEERIDGLLAPEHSDTLNGVCETLSNDLGLRITVIQPDGVVLVDTHALLAELNNHGQRPEVIAARQDGSGQSIRYSQTLKVDQVYFARAVKDGERLLGFVRVSKALTGARSTLDGIMRKITVGGLVVAAVAVLINLVISQRLVARLRQIRAAIVRYARGDFSTPVPDPRISEFREVADAMNSMAQQLDAQIRTVENHRAEQAAMFSSMEEGVIAIAEDETIISYNAAATELLGIRALTPGQPLRDYVRHPGLLSFIEQTLQSEQAQEEDALVLADAVVVHAHGSRLKDPSGELRGGLIVLHDVSELKRLENIRRDFVSNVSHELKTPITSIQGFVETLQAGAMDDPEHANRFLGIIAKHSERLGSIIDDLLMLSRIEQAHDEHALERTPHALAEMVDTVMHLCAERAEKRSVTLTTDEIDAGLVLNVNERMFELALTNLIDNAIRYSGEGATARIGVDTDAAETRISVADTGPGIAASHLDRVFERFYCADKARSRELGGTGLGLALVKHIAAAHGGTVTVDSREGVGTTFTIHLPTAT